MSCLFDALQKHLDNIDSQTLRNIICDYLTNNPVLMDELCAEKVIYHESKKSLVEYVKQMRRGSTWGGSIEIKAFCNIYRIKVNVINIRDRFSNSKKKIIEFIPNDENVSVQKKIQITWSGNHFENII